MIEAVSHEGPLQQNGETREGGSRRLGIGSADLTLWDDANGATRFKPGRGLSAERGFVLSLPKAGTYLMARILVEAGLVDTEVHATPHSFSDYRFLDRAEKLTRPERFTVQLPLDVSADFIGRGQFAVGHVGHDACTQAALSPFKKLLLVREHRGVLLSAMRFEEKRLAFLGSDAKPTWSERGQIADKLKAYLAERGADLLEYSQRMVPWLSQADVPVVRFEDLVGVNGRDPQGAVVNQVLCHMGLQSGPQMVERVVAASLHRQTLTYSGSLSKLADVWDDELEALFQSIGGEKLNKAYGYAPNLLDRKRRDDGI